MAYDVERVVLGGGVSHAGETFVRPIQRELDRMRAASALAGEQLHAGRSSSCCRPVPMPGHGARWSIAGRGRMPGSDAGHGWEEVGHVREHVKVHRLSRSHQVSIEKEHTPSMRNAPDTSP